jgi:hypothetical protein
MPDLDLELAPELWSVEVSWTEFEQVPALELERSRELVQVVSGLELALELELEA